MLIKSSFKQSLITVTDDVENYPGFDDTISGFEIVDKMSRQAEKFGMESIDGDVEEIRRCENCWEVVTAEGSFRTLSVIIASGATPAMVGAAGEKELTGRGVSYCATCDGPFYRDREVVVVGGGDTAVQEALFLTKFASRVTIVHRRDRLRATGILRDRALENEKIRFEWDSAVDEILGDSGVTGVRLKNVKTGATKEIQADGVFVFIGYKPQTSCAGKTVDLDAGGYIITDENMRTSADGIFAAGDCRRKPFRQVITACGDGATAAHAVEIYIDEIKGQSYGTEKV